MKPGLSKTPLHERLRQKLDQNADHQLASVATQIESFTSDINARVERGLSTTGSDIDRFSSSLSQKLQDLERQTELWIEQAETAAKLMRKARLDWIRDGVFTLIIPMVIGALMSGIVGALVAALILSTPSPPPARPPASEVDMTTGLGGLGRVLRHPPASEVVPCPLRSAPDSLCVKLPRETR